MVLVLLPRQEAHGKDFGAKLLAVMLEMDLRGKGVMVLNLDNRVTTMIAAGDDGFDPVHIAMMNLM